MKRRPKTIASTGGNGGTQGSSAESAFEWQQTQQLSDQVMLKDKNYIAGNRCSILPL